MADLHVPVLIIGGGASGMCASIFLSSAGVEHLLVERHQDTSELPKAHYINQRTMEIFRQHGLADVVYHKGATLRHMAKVARQTTLGGDGPFDRHVFQVIDAFGGGPLYQRYSRDSPCLSTNLPQIRLEPLLRERADNDAPGMVRFGHEMANFVQDAAGVTATIRDLSDCREYSVRADYLIGADGGVGVGKAIGATMTGLLDLGEYVSAHIIADLSEWWDDEILMSSFDNVDEVGVRHVASVAAMGPTWGAHSEEWAFHIPLAPGDTTIYDEATIAAKFREILKVGDIDIKILKTTRWRVEGVLSDKYAEGRVFLVGDAAHRHTPATGLGLNSAVQDVHNLAWKLAAVTKGEASASVLATYAEERVPVGRRNIDWATFTLGNKRISEAALGRYPAGSASGLQRQAYESFSSDTAIGVTLRARFTEAAAVARTEFQAHDLEIGFAYEAGAIVPDGSAPPPRDPIGLIYRPTTRPGHRLPHAWLVRDEARVSTHDLVAADGGLTLYVGSQPQAWSAAAASAAEKFGVRITVVAIGSEFRDVAGTWAEVREVGSDGAVLVRPDHHVAWRAMNLPEDPEHSLAQAVGAVLGR
jgi:2,4-dichlorophenol 6-monooxygenase